jgi:hypothetical protein
MMMPALTTWLVAATYNNRGSFSEGHEDGSFGKQCLEFVEGLLGLGCLGEVHRFLKEAVQGYTLFTKA